MDSWAEAEWLQRFRQAMAGRTVIIITHRFTTAMQADAIHVFVGGNVVESGTHQHLLAQGGLYAQSWQAQIEVGLREDEFQTTASAFGYEGGTNAGTITAAAGSGSTQNG